MGLYGRAWLVVAILVGSLGVGETVLAVPVTIPLSAMLAQAVGLATGHRTGLDYELRGRLAGPGFGGVSFRSTGQLVPS